VLLDAAALASSSPLDLTAVQPDFVTLSFYKMFGFPTGVGALLIRRTSAHFLNLARRRYFGGGSLKAYSSQYAFHVPREGLEDALHEGTPPFLDILALESGFAALEQLGMQAISNHTFSLAQRGYGALRALAHYNGTPVVTLYCSTNFESPLTQGPILSFNLRRADGTWVGFAEVAKMASLHNIHLRTGCLCNAGACHAFLGLSLEDLKANAAAGYSCGDEHDLMSGRPVGSVRASFGYTSSEADLEKLLWLISEYFVDRAPSSRKLQALAGVLDAGAPLDPVQRARAAHATVATGIPPDSSMEGPPIQRASVAGLVLFPVKSCGGFAVDSWEICEKGFRFDREWMVVDAATGECLTQKKEPRMCLIRPHIDIASGTLVLASALTEPREVSVPLAPPTEAAAASTLFRCQARVCNDDVSGHDCGDAVGEWLSACLKRACRLVRQPAEESRACHLSEARAKTKTPQECASPMVVSRGAAALSFSNESQFLLASQASMDALNASRRERYEDTGLPDVPVDRFRANIVIEGAHSFAEDEWEAIQIENQHFKVVGPCQRCQMVCIDQATGERSAEPLQTLAHTRRFKVSSVLQLSKPHSPSLLSRIFLPSLSIFASYFPLAKGRTFFGMHLLHDRDKSMAPFVIAKGMDVAVLRTLQFLPAESASEDDEEGL
jgi:molybdenum cofactor sulfurtransferase